MAAGTGTGEGKKYVNVLGDQIVTATGGNPPHIHLFSPATPPPHSEQGSLATAMSSRNRTVGGPAQHLSALFSSFPITLSF